MGRFFCWGGGTGANPPRRERNREYGPIGPQLLPSCSFTRQLHGNGDAAGFFLYRPSDSTSSGIGPAGSLESTLAPPHALRHTGPSYDLLEQGSPSRPYRTLAQVQHRGRWAAEKSVLRYGKTMFYLRALAAVPEHLVKYGERRRAALGSRPEVAIN